MAESRETVAGAIADTQDITVSVCYATPSTVFLRELAVSAGSTLHAAIQRSGLLQEAPDIDLSVCRVGIHGKLKALESVLREGDRVEVYRALLADPMDARRRRALKKSAATAKDA